jgi:hypothetical protein
VLEFEAKNVNICNFFLAVPVLCSFLLGIRKNTIYRANEELQNCQYFVNNCNSRGEILIFIKRSTEKNQRDKFMESEFCGCFLKEEKGKEASEFNIML